jgi:hypothetical protein
METLLFVFGKKRVKSRAVRNLREKEVDRFETKSQMLQGKSENQSVVRSAYSTSENWDRRDLMMRRRRRKARSTVVVCHKAYLLRSHHSVGNVYFVITSNGYFGYYTSPMQWRRINACDTCCNSTVERRMTVNRWNGELQNYTWKVIKFRIRYEHVDSFFLL